MVSSIRSRLKSLEGRRKQAEGEDQEELGKEIAKFERRACCLLAHMRHHDGEPLDSVLPNMLRYFDESEARRILAMDSDAMYQAVGMPVFTASKTALPAKSEEKAKPQARIPGEWGRGR